MLVVPASLQCFLSVSLATTVLLVLTAEVLKPSQAPEILQLGILVVRLLGATLL